MDYDNNYIKPEMRNDWLVDEKTKKVWYVLLDLIKQLDKICTRNGLKWYPLFGTLLGAVRHNGFIPWDDDVDIGMPREDYDRLVDICSKGLDYPYFLQTTESDNECYKYLATLRNSETTGNRACCLKLDQNSGIGISIFPLEGCGSSLALFRLRRFPMYVASVLCNTYVNEINTSKKAVVLRKALRIISFDYKKINRIIENINSRHPMRGSSMCTTTLQRDPTTKHIKQQVWKREWFDKTIDFQFENINVPIPCGYDSILRSFYGDYMKFPPLEKRQGKHDIVYEPDVPYREYKIKHGL